MSGKIMPLSTPFPASDFDDWAASYDQDVGTDRFPFEGYAGALKTAYEQVSACAGVYTIHQ